MPSRTPRRSWRASPAAALLALAAVAPAAGVAGAQTFYQPQVAAFYQHQNSYQGVWPTTPPTAYPGPPDAAPDPLVPSYEIDPGNHWWESGGGWCGTTAWVNGVYSLDKRGFPGLFDHSALGAYHQGRDWLERFVYANEDLAIDAGGGAFASCVDFPRAGANLAPRQVIPDYADYYGYGKALRYNEYYWDGVNDQVKLRTAAGDVVTPFATMFDLYRDQLLRGRATAVLIQGTGPWWWSGSFHVITGAGVDLDPAELTLYFADPDEGRAGGTGWGHPFDDLTDPVPVGPAYYNLATLDPDGRTIVAGRYDGAFITEIHTLAAVPEPATLALCATGVVLLVAVRVVRVRRPGVA